MKKLGKLLIGCGLVFQTTLFTAFASNTYTSTAGTLKADQDKVTDLNYYTELQFDKGMGYTNLSNLGLQFGGATRINDLYFGANYSGDLWGKLTGEDRDSSTSVTNKDNQNPDNNTSSKKETDYDKIDANSQTHNFNILLGLKDMGFRLNSYLSFNGTIEDTKNNNLDTSSITTTENYPGFTTENVKNLNDTYRIGLDWGGMTFNKKDLILKPYAGFGLYFRYMPTITKTKTVRKVYDTNNAKYTTDTLKTIYENDAYGSYTEVSFNGGSELVWGKGSNFMQVVNLSTDFYTKIYPSKKYRKDTSYGDNVNADNSYTENSLTQIRGKVTIGDTLYTNYRFEYKPTDKLTIGGKAGLNTYLSFENPGKREITTTRKQGEVTTVTKQFQDYDYASGNFVTGSDSITSVNGKDNEVSSYKSVDKKNSAFSTTFNPSFAFGLSYDVKPNFTVNLGYSGTLPSIEINSTSSKTHTTNTAYSDPATKDINETTTTDAKVSNVSVRTGNWSSNLYTGFVLGIGQYCDLDVQVSLGRSPSLNTLWTAGWNLGFSIKM